jgi:hypothetical protein
MTWWVKPLVFPIATAALIASVALFISYERGIGAKAATAKAEAAYAEGYAVAASAVRADETRKRAATEKAHAEDIERADARNAADLAARSRLERLLARSASVGRAAQGEPGQTGPVVDATAPVFRSLFEACAVEYGSLGQDIGRLADQVIGLQNYLLANEIGGDSPVGVRPRAGVAHSLAIQPTAAPSWPTPAGAAPPQGSIL